MKTQEWKDCYVHRNTGIRASNAKYETGMKELIGRMFIREPSWKYSMNLDGS